MIFNHMNLESDFFFFCKKTQIEKIPPETLKLPATLLVERHQKDYTPIIVA